MRRVLGLIAVVSLLVAMAGCCAHKGSLIQGSCAKAPENCTSCGCENGDPNCGCNRGCGLRGQMEPPPPTGAVAYPYYTTRGPRDFLARNPASIGP